MILGLPTIQASVSLYLATALFGSVCCGEMDHRRAVKHVLLLLW